MRWVSRVASILFSTLTIFTLIAASPLFVQWYTRQFQLDWLTLGNAGQAYGFISAIFSALAFGVIAWSAQLQTKETRAQRLESFRATHIRIFELALNDPYLLACWPMTQEEMGREKRQAYLNLLLWWWHYNFCEGLGTEPELRYEVAYLLRGEAGREFLLRNRRFRLEPQTRTSARFFQIIDEEYNKAIAAGPGIPFALHALDTPSTTGRRSPSMPVKASYIGGLGLGIGLVAGWLSGSVKRWH